MEFQAPPLSAWGLLRRYALVSGLGLSVLGAGALPQRALAAPTFGTPGWYAQQNAQRLAAPAAGARSAGNINNAVNAPGTVVTASEALQRAQQSINDLNNALAAIRSQQAAQQAAAKAALNLTSNVPDGLGVGGLQIHVNADGTNSVSGVDTISQKPGSSAGAVTVTVDQTAAKAILNWDTFNVGKNTTLHFDQTKGTQANGSNNWVALNRVLDTANPTRILGSIKAEGDVYIINQGGILFGGTSQVNTHSLIASSLPFLGDLCRPDCSASNTAFLNQGLGLGSNTPVIGMTDAQFEQALQAGQAPGKIRIDAGASISTGALGFVLIAAPEVSNAGTINATDGQAILAGGVSVALGNSGNQAAGANLPNLLVPTLTENVPVQGLAADALSVTNTGLIQAQRGNITLTGLSVTQAGVVATSTSITRPGSIVLAAGDDSGARVGPLVLAPGSVTAILPDTDGETTTSTSTATSQFVSGSALLTGNSVTLVKGSLLEAPGATVSVVAAPDAKAARINTPGSAGYDPGVAGRVYLDDGAVVDVSGLADVELSVADTLVTIPRVGLNELADSPLLRDGFLYGQSVTVDSTISGVRADGKTWIGSPIVDASGYVANVPRSVNQLLTQAGTLNLAGAEVITHAGSVINLQGGFINYLGGMTTGTTRLVGADGRIYDISNADPNIQYTGFAGQYSAAHPRWGYTDTYVDPLTSGALSHYQTGFIQGGDAGTLNIYASNGLQGVGNGSAILNGTILAQAFAGRNQVAYNRRPAGGSFSIGQGIGSSIVTPFGQAAIGNLMFPATSGSGGSLPPSGSNFIVSAQGTALDDIAPGFGADTALGTPAMLGKSASDTSNVLYWTPLSATALSNAGFSSVSLNALGQIQVAQDATLAVQAGGKRLSQGVRGGGNGDSVSLTAASTITVDGTISAPSGSISLGTTDSGNIVLGAGARLDASGAFVNDSGLTLDQVTGSQFLNGGTVRLSTAASDHNSAGQDSTGSIILGAGSLIDVSSGAYVKASGAPLSSGGLLQGQGGAITLDTYSGGFGGVSGPLLPSAMPTNGTIQGLVDATGHSTGVLRAYGFSGGGRLNLQAAGFQIGDQGNAHAWDLYLDPGFFQQGGFGSYTLSALYEATISNATVSLSQQNYLPNTSALLHAPSGSSLYGSGLTSVGSLDPYYRPPVSLTVSSGAYLNWAGPITDGIAGFTPQYTGATGNLLLAQNAAIVGDAGASITLNSLQRVDVEGTIRTAGGNISLAQLQPGVHGPGIADNLGVLGVTVGSGSVLDASGTVLYNPNAPVIGGSKQRSGKLLAGGTVSIQADTARNANPGLPPEVLGGDVVVETGARIDVSGAAATFDLPQFAGAGYAATPVWSNAGGITLGAGNNLVFLGSITAKPGSPAGDGGSLTITALDTASALILQQTAPAGLLPAGWQPGQALSNAATAGTLYFSADRLDGSGIASLTINSNALAADSQVHGTTQSQPGVLSLGFAGDVNLSLSKSFTANAATYVALDAGATSIPVFSQGTSTTSGGKIDISAPYVALQGYSNTLNPFNFQPVAVQGNGTLNVNASFIDINGDFALQNFANANFNSSGDIRFYTPIANGYNAKDAAIHPGELYTAGNLSFSAGQIYPGSASTFVIYAGGSGNPLNAGCAAAAICFELANGSNPPLAPPPTPLSAGGTLIVDAATIVQDGVLRAPAGSLILGVGSTTDASVSSVLQGLNTAPVTTQSATLGAYSTTSVSLDGAVIPYGTTLDGKEWQYNQLLGTTANSTSPDLTAPPAKLISINGQNVSIDHDATVDLSGGGDLQAQEWVPGTGGSRNVLTQSVTSYPTAPVNSTVSPTTTYLYPDQRQVYAVIPAGGYYSSSKPTPGVAVAPYDPVTAANGPAAGQTVYLSGAPGLPAGWYTLLPASYATLPGAYRVVQNTSAVDNTATQNRVLQDGTDVVAGYFVDGLSGASAARSTSFNVQSATVWQQYSQYTLSSANTFFANLAAKSGTAVPQLPIDAGQLILGASGSLNLGDGGSPRLLTAGASGGAAAQIDIASQDIQIVGNGQTALSGYVQLSAATLDKLGAGSLLIGGTRSQTSSGVSINVTADSVVLSNDSADPLQGPEILLAAKGDAAGADANRLANKLPDGVLVQSGSVIRASGTLPANPRQGITISGDGALLRVSQAGAVSLTRTGVSRAAGDVNIGAGATIDGGKYLLLDATGGTSLDPTAKLSATDNFTVDAGSIVLVNGDTAPTGASGFIIGSNTLAQISGAQQLDLRSYGAIDFEGGGSPAGCSGFCLDLAKGNLTLSAGTLQTGLYGAATAVSVNVSSGTLTLTNDLNAPVLANPAAGPSAVTLALNAPEIDFGTAGSTLKSTMNFSGFGGVTATAAPAAGAASAGAGIVGQGDQSFDFGTLPVTLNAPVILAGTNSGVSLRTSGKLLLASAGGTALAAADAMVGGAISLSGGSVDDGAMIQARAGNVSLDASSGDLSMASGATISTAGVARQFYDVTEYAPGGHISLAADAGKVMVQSGARLDFSGAAAGGDAGSLSLSAPASGMSVSIDPAAVIKGTVASGYHGGTFSEDVGGAADLHQLAGLLSADGTLSGLSVRSGSGDLSLSSGDRLTAQNVYLNAAGGNVSLAAGSTINANGAMQADGTQAAGGGINLYGVHGVDVEGTLSATTGNASQRGGTVNIGTGIISSASVSSYNTDYGYENIGADNSGSIRIGSTAVIDVSGGSAGGLSGGSVSLRAPLLQTGQVNVDLSQLVSASIKGARDVGLEAYAVWSTTDGTTGGHHFDGIIDPSGKTDASGKAFYQTTLVNFVESPGGLSSDPANPAANHVSSSPRPFAFDGTTGANIANFHVRAGIELDNPDGTVNNGDISLLSNWNLGAGTGQGGNIKLYYRYGNEAPVLTLRAANNLRIGANLGDGFYFQGSGSNPLTKSAFGNGISSSSADEIFYTLMPLSLDPSNLVGGSSSYRLVAGSDFGSADPLGLLSPAQLAADFSGGGNVILSGSAQATDKTARRPVELPTMVRTGTGFIDVSAAGSFSLYDPVANPGGQNVLAPAVLYTAGAPDAQAPLPVTRFSPTSSLLATADIPETAVTGAVNPDAAGDLSIHAQGDILGLEQVYDDGNGSLTSAPNNFIAQFWWPWMQLGKTASRATINFGGFDQGILSAGGNVSVSAGGDIRELSVSLPTTWYLSTDPVSGQNTVNTVGGGNLSVRAGRDILSGSYFVSNGSGSIVAGGSIAPDFSLNLAALNPNIPGTATAVPVSTLLALQQDSMLKVSARQGVDIGGVYNPSYLADQTLDNQIHAQAFDSQGYGSGSSLSLFASTGDIRFGTLTEPAAVFEYGLAANSAVQPGQVPNPALILPANLSFTAFAGSVSINGTGTMAPSANGELSVMADGDVQLSDSIDAASPATGLGLSDAAASAFPSPLNPLTANAGYQPFLTALNLVSGHDTTPVHVNDAAPVRVYSRSGSIIDAAGGSVQLITPKPAQIYAAQDIVDLSLLAQNLHDTDVTRVVAGRDIYDTPQSGPVGSNVFGSALQVAGPGYFDLEAGRNLGPLATPGISTIGNADNPNLPHQGASIQVLYGVGPTLDVANAVLDASAFISRYIDPAHAGSSAGVPSYASDLASFMARYPAQLAAASGDPWKAFQSLSRTQQNLFVGQVFYKILQLTAHDYNDSSSPYFHQYERGYQAINTLFPPTAGYTANNLNGGANGTIGQPVDTGDLDIRNSTIQTQQGGNISLFGPGGQALVGSTSAPPVLVNNAGVVAVGAAGLGILTLEKGDIDIFTDRSLLLAQSRVFTEQGGDMLIWSSNGDINAGKGAKTTAETPPPVYNCDADHYCTVDARGQVSGAGIATLQTVPGAAPGNVFLVAPRGTVDAGEAGIRVSGNLVVAAQAVANASNIQVSGNKVGVPVVAHVDTGALAAANAAAAAAEQAAAPSANTGERAASLITVEVVGLGSPDEEEKRRLRRKMEGN